MTLRQEQWRDQNHMQIDCPLKLFRQQTTYIGVSPGEVDEATQYSDFVTASSSLEDFAARGIHADVLKDVRQWLTYRKEKHGEPGGYLYLFFHLYDPGKKKQKVRVNDGLVLTTHNHWLIYPWNFKDSRETILTVMEATSYVVHNDLADYYSFYISKYYATQQQQQKGA